MIYIYGLVCPIEGAIRYIGKCTTPKKRLSAHICTARSGEADHHCARWIRSLLRQGMMPTMRILRTLDGGEDWEAAEREAIAEHRMRGLNLTNSTAGGDGGDAEFNRIRFAIPENRAAHSARMKEIYASDKMRGVASARSFSTWADPEITARRIASLKAAHSRPETIERVRAAKAISNANPETKARRSASGKARWTEEARIAKAASVDRKAASEKAKAQWADPEKYAALLAYRQTPEYRAKQAESAKRRATPEYRAMMAEKTRLSWEKRKTKQQAFLTALSD